MSMRHRVHVSTRRLKTLTRFDFQTPQSDKSAKKKIFGKKYKSWINIYSEMKDNTKDIVVL